MAIPSNIEEREHDKFLESPVRPNKSAIETVDFSNRFGVDSRVTKIEVTVSGNIEIYNYKAGSTLIKTIKVTYDDSSRRELSSVEIIYELPF